MAGSDSIDAIFEEPPFDRFQSVQRLSTDRGGHAAGAHGRHHLYVVRDPDRRANLLIKVTAKPGLVYERDLTNELETLQAINRDLPDSLYFPFIEEHGRLRDGRVYLAMSCFDEWPLATTIGTEPIPGRLVGYLRTTVEITRALEALHSIAIWHVDLNPMNILYRSERGQPVIRIVDFESSYHVSRHGQGAFYSPPTTAGFVAPELLDGIPDARSDIYSLGAVLYTLLAGYDWTWTSDVVSAIASGPEIDQPLKDALLRAVARKPDDRFGSAAQFRHALTDYLETIWSSGE